MMLHACSRLSLVFALLIFGAYAQCPAPEVRFSDYREIGGVQIPFKVTTKFPTPVLGTVTYQVEKIESGLKLDQDPFKIK